MADSDHFAHIKIERVRKRVNQDRGSASSGAVSRDVIETTNLTIKAGTLEALRTKVNAHVGLLDEDDI